jgi:glycosyltransferase involved in cell wall biosynthesis
MHLSDVKDNELEWNFLTPRSFDNSFGTKCNYESLSFRRRYLPSICPEYNLWHAIHQDSAYFPGHKKTIYILTIHDLNFLREKSPMQAENILNHLQRKVDRASYITFISNFTASEAVKYLEFSNKPTCVIHNGVEINTETEVRRPVYLPEAKYLFSLGMILEKKNFHILIDFIEKINEYNLVIAGDKSHPYAVRLEHEIKRRKLTHKIIMPGIISNEDKIYLYKNCEAFLFPSLNEGFGMPVIEAMRFGKPVFTSRFSSLPEIGGDHAFYWDSFDPIHMIEIFNKKLGYYNENKSFISNDLINYSRIYSWEKSIHAYLQVYRELLGISPSETPEIYSNKDETSSVKKRIRVLHLSSENDWRGGEQQIAYLVSDLNKMGIENIIGCAKHSKFEKLCKTSGWEYFSAKFSSYLNIDTAIMVAKTCRKYKIDILHLHTSKSHTVGVLSTLFGHEAKLILTRRVDNQVGRNIMSRWKYNHPRIKRIITVSDKIREVVNPVLKNPSKSITIHSGIDISKFYQNKRNDVLRKQLNIPPDFILVGNTSAIAKHKDYFTFIKTCDWLINKGFKSKFIIIGEGPEEENIRHYITEKKMDQHIFMIGFRNDIPAILPELDIFLMTSITEGLGTSILDAFAARVPVVATRAGGIPEMVKDGTTGLLADPGDYTKLGENIMKLSKDPELRKKLTDNAYQLLLNDFTKEIMAKKVLNQYMEILQ